MFMVTNREPLKKTGGPDILGKTPNAKGPHELRLVEAHKRSGKWKLTVLPDTIQSEDSSKKIHITDYVAQKLLNQINPKSCNPDSRQKGRNLLVFVHGFNNDVKDVLERCEKLSKNFSLEVFPFTWPANGGGTLGIASYKSDKRDAKASVGALDRVLYVIGEKIKLLISDQIALIEKEAKKKHPNNEELQNTLIARTRDIRCPFTINLMTHSMGTYLYKQLLLSSISEGNKLTFDNVILASADTNNEDHALWVDKIRARRRVYITINEDDLALQASRMKSGEEQRARLGHYPFNLYSRHAAYVQFTDADGVGNSHAYFEDEPLKNPKIKQFFKAILNGVRGDNQLRYDAASNTYRF